MHTQLWLFDANNVVHYSTPTKQAYPLLCLLTDKPYCTDIDNRPLSNYKVRQIGDNLKLSTRIIN